MYLPAQYPADVQAPTLFRRFYRDYRHSGCNLLQISLCIVIAQHNARTHVFIFTNAFQQIYRNLVFSPGMLTAQIYIIKQYFFGSSSFIILTTFTFLMPFIRTAHRNNV